jgi:hypothetical protein
MATRSTEDLGSNTLGVFDKGSKFDETEWENTISEFLDNRYDIASTRTSHSMPLPPNVSSWRFEVATLLTDSYHEQDIPSHTTNNPVL